MKTAVYVHGTREEEQGRLALLNRLTNDAFVAFLELREDGAVLEVGSGLGILTDEVARRVPRGVVRGVEKSLEQLTQARRSFPHLDFVHADAHSLPFPDGSFDLVLTSAVILHNAPPIADAIRREVIRVSRRLVAHNEDTDVTYNRYGYDTGAIYRGRGIRLLECGPIPGADASQFCVAEPWPASP